MHISKEHSRFREEIRAQAGQNRGKEMTWGSQPQSRKEGGSASDRLVAG